MSAAIIEVNQISKRYRLGHFGMSSFREESEKWLRRLRGISEPQTDNSTERDFWALRDVSFSVQPGEVVGIIGRNGAGKSTLLKILSRITEPTTGEIILRGRVASLLEVGTGFHPELSGRDNIYLNGAILGMKRAEIAAKFDEIVAFAEIGRFIDTPVKRYSSGMYVRLAFAVAAHLEPDILIVDEVLAVGDAAFQKKCVAKMGEVSGHGRTVLFVSHNIGLIDALCHSTVYLQDGQVAYQGDVKTALGLYSSQSETQQEYVRDASVKDASTPRIKSVRIAPALGEIVIGANSGYTISIEATQNLPNLGALVFIRNSSGVVINYFNTAFVGDRDICASPAPCKFHLTVDKSQLPPGTYTVDAYLSAPSGNLDVVEKACLLEISDGYIDGRASREYTGKCSTLIRHSWNLE